MSYENYEIVKQWKSDKFASYTNDERLCFNSELLDFFPSRELHQVNVCDIGFGNGNFMGWCRDQGWSCDGIEVNQFLIERAINNKLRVFSSIEALTISQPGTTYDLITAFDVLEHIDRGQIVNFLTKIKSICHSNTIILLRFPNGDNPFSSFIQNGDVTHQTFVGQSLLRQVAEMAGVNVIRLGGEKTPILGKPISKVWLLIIRLSIRYLFGNFIRLVFMRGNQISFSLNLVAILKLQRNTQ